MARCPLLIAGWVLRICGAEPPPRLGHSLPQGRSPQGIQRLALVVGTRRGFVTNGGQVLANPGRRHKTRLCKAPRVQLWLGLVVGRGQIPVDVVTEHTPSQSAAVL
jgi:hypothetical protein